MTRSRTAPGAPASVQLVGHAAGRDPHGRHHGRRPTTAAGDARGRQRHDRHRSRRRPRSRRPRPSPRPKPTPKPTPTPTPKPTPRPTPRRRPGPPRCRPPNREPPRPDAQADAPPDPSAGGDPAPAPATHRDALPTATADPTPTTTLSPVCRPRPDRGGPAGDPSRRRSPRARPRPRRRATRRRWPSSAAPTRGAGRPAPRPAARTARRARARTGRGGQPAAWGPVAAVLAMAGLHGPTLPPLGLAPTLVTTTGAVTAAMALGLFGRKRRDDDPPDEGVLAAAAAAGVGAVAAGLRPTRRPASASSTARSPATDAGDVADMELLLPRWRRPSLLQARKADPIRDNDAGPAPDLRRRPRRPAGRPRAPGHPLPRRPPARLAGRAARRRDRLSRPGRRGPAAREVRRLLAGPEPRRPAGLAPQDDPGRHRRGARSRAPDVPVATMPIVAGDAGRWASPTSTATSSRPTSSRAAARG